MSQTDTKTMTRLQERAVNTIRALTIDATQEAGSGHPGMPMGAAPMAYVLWTKFLKHNPKNPQWTNRDRYIQSAGHGSMLQYSLLHLTGYDLSMDELRNYRQWGSLTPGHPEYGLTPGVETTTGPLGQGISNAVGFALAEAHLAAVYNRPGHDVIDHFTYVIASDGDVMEGVSNEACSIAGHLGLGKLIVLYDDNNITIDGPTDITFTEDVLGRYEAYGWHTQRVEDGNDLAGIEAAIKAAQLEPIRPSIIAVRTTIGYGSPEMAGTSDVHGSPLGDDEAKATKEQLGIDWEPFTVPDDVLEHYRAALEAGDTAERLWNDRFESYQNEHADLAAQLGRVLDGHLPDNLSDLVPSFEVGGKDATRNSSGKVMNALAPHVPQFMGGSADLAGSNKNTLKDYGHIDRGDFGGRNLNFGVREHGMAAICNGLALHGGIRPFAATFLIFSDYLRPSLRLAALMELPVAYIFTHDSIGLGGDGPTHQPVAQLMALRAIPHMTVFRPADANETSQAWVHTLENKTGPSALALTRQSVPHLNVPKGSVAKGGYVLADCDGTPDVILIGTGSEVHNCVEAKEGLEQDGIKTRVVSMPSLELFDAQDAAYRESVLPRAVKKRVSVEAGASLGWHKYVGDEGAVIALDSFGASAEGDVLMEKFGFSVGNIVATAKGLLG